MSKGSLLSGLSALKEPFLQKVTVVRHLQEAHDTVERWLGGRGGDLRSLLLRVERGTPSLHFNSMTVCCDEMGGICDVGRRSPLQEI